MHTSLEEWSEWLRAAGDSPATIRTRTSGVQALQHYARLADPREVATRQILSWLGGCKSPWSRSTYYASAQQWCAFLVDSGQRDDDPMQRVPKPKRPRGLPRPASERVVRRLLRDPPGHRSYAYIALASYAALRVSEIAQIRGEHVDAEWLFINGKGDQQAMVPMHPVVQMLAKGMPDTDWWFPGRHDGHVAPDTVSRVVRNAFKSVGSTATAHQCRHLAGTALLRECHDVRLVQRFLRHESLNSTQIYTQVSNSDLMAAVRSLDWAA